MSGQLQSPAALPSEERAPGTHSIGGWVDPRAGLDDVEEKFLTLPGLQLRPLGRPAHSQSLYRRRYPGSSTRDYNLEITITHRLVFSVTAFTALHGSAFNGVASSVSVSNGSCPSWAVHLQLLSCTNWLPTAQLTHNAQSTPYVASARTA
jgi:hypothetical protein